MGYYVFATIALIGTIRAHATQRVCPDAPEYVSPRRSFACHERKVGVERTYLCFEETVATCPSESYNNGNEQHAQEQLGPTYDVNVETTDYAKRKGLNAHISEKNAQQTTNDASDSANTETNTTVHSLFSIATRPLATTTTQKKTTRPRPHNPTPLPSGKTPPSPSAATGKKVTMTA